MSFVLPWANQNVLNATKRLQRLTPSTPWLPDMPAPAASFVPETAPAFGDYGPWIRGMPAPSTLPETWVDKPGVPTASPQRMEPIRPFEPVIGRYDPTGAPPVGEIPRLVMDV